MLTKEILEGSDKKLRRFGLRVSSLDYGSKKEQKSLSQEQKNADFESQEEQSELDSIPAFLRRQKK